MSWDDVLDGALLKSRGLSMMGVTDEVRVAISPEDGRRIEAQFSDHGEFKTQTMPSGATVKAVPIGGVYFCWETHP